MNDTNFKCRWCSLGVERRRGADGVWRHVALDPKDHLITMGYPPELVVRVGTQWMEVSEENSICLQLHPERAGRERYGPWGAKVAHA